jgi:hypothetical protein
MREYSVGVIILDNLSPNQWDAIAAVAQVFAALATLAAVFVAVHQWKHQWRPKLRVTLDMMMTTNTHVPPKEWVAITVTNVGICAVKVTGIQYRPHKFAKMRWFHPPDFNNPLCTKLPVKLEQTDSANLLWKPGDWDTAICGALKQSLNASNFFRLIWRYTILVEIKTSIGDSFLARVSPSMIARLEEKLNSSI